MRSPYPGIIVLIVLLIAVFAAGCTAGEPSPEAGPGTSVETSPAHPATTHTAAITLTPAIPGCAYPPLNPWTWVPESYSTPKTVKIPPEPGSKISRADLFGTPSLIWDEYAFTQQVVGIPDSNGTLRTEMSLMDSGGRSRYHENMTYKHLMMWGTGEISDTTIDDMYYDENGTMQAMHRRVIQNGRFVEDTDYPPVNGNKGIPDCREYLFEPRYTCTGTDPVTVPAGTFPDALRYSQQTIGDDGNTIVASETCWFSPGVPVPVKRVIEEPGKHTATFELMGWG